MWAGNATCKQLAAAESSLRAALGVDPGTLALGGFATDVREHVSRVLAPADALKGVLEQVVARLDTEVKSALAAVEASDKAAAEDRGLRDRAERQAAESEQAAAEARASAEEHAAARQAAEHARDEAAAKARAAELKQARAESRRDAEHERAEQAEHRARDAAQREHTALQAAAAAGQELASVRAELAGLEQRLVDDRAAATKALARAEAALESARADTAGVRAELARVEERHRTELDRHATRAETRLSTLTREHQDAVADLHQKLGAALQRATLAETAATELREAAAQPPGNTAGSDRSPHTPSHVTDRADKETVSADPSIGSPSRSGSDQSPTPPT
ncbi:coiled-coil domain-containing protein [Actinokineospora alba]|uniref:hypothetical protein n=1 Tax=Actinokineospora alba TaxID=504798 RepID=UPI000B86D117|nr:hypothetical protein [Actinokineospora alba]